MTRMMRAALLGAAITAACPVVPAGAALTIFTSRATFDAAAGPTIIQDFNSFLTDTEFRTAPVNVAGQFTLSVTGNVGGFTNDNKIDALPLQSSESDVNGTADVRVFTIQGSTFVITFANPVTAFGADFANINDDVARTTITAGGSTVAPVVAPLGTIRFFGFTSTTPFTTVTFNGLENDVFGVDNVAFNGRVPEPAQWALLLLGFGAVGVTMRRPKVRMALA